MLRQRLTYIFMMLTNLCVFVFTNSRVPLIAAAVMITAPIISYIFLRIAAANVAMDFSVRRVVSAEDFVEATVRVDSRLRMYPGMISIGRRVRSVMFDYTRESVIDHELVGAAKEISVGFTALFCGVHEFALHDIKLYDAFRLFSCGTKYSFDETITVNPRAVEMRVFRRASSAAESDGTVYDKYHRGNDRSEVCCHY